MTVTIRDVAADVGVSVATVSRALRNLPGVAESTRTVVLRSAERLGYTMAPMSISRSAGHRRCIAVLAPAIDTWFFGTALTSVIVSLVQYGYRTEVSIVADEAERRAFFAAAPRRPGLSGVMVVGMALSDAEIGSLRSLRVEVVGLHANHGAFDNVAADDLGIARLATDHLIGLGHRRIAMISSNPGTPTPHAVPHFRTVGYRTALGAARIPLEPGLMVCGLDSVEGGALAMRFLMARAELPSAVFAQTDEMAFGALNALRRSKVDVPRDISVVGVDDHVLASALELTTVAQHVPAQATAAADLMARRLATHPHGRPVAETTRAAPAPHLVLRSTTGPPPARPAPSPSGGVYPPRGSHSGPGDAGQTSSQSGQYR